MNNTFDSLYQAFDAKYGFPLGLLKSLAIQESGENPWAFRYEPAFFGHYILGLTIIAPKGCSLESEARARATSWGLIQCMGQVARELGFNEPFLSELCDPEVGLNYGAQHLAKKIARYGGIADGVSAYNAGKPTDANRSSYVQPILARLGQ